MKHPFKSEIDLMEIVCADFVDDLGKMVFGAAVSGKYSFASISEDVGDIVKVVRTMKSLINVIENLNCSNLWTEGGED